MDWITHGLNKSLLYILMIGSGLNNSFGHDEVNENKILNNNIRMKFIYTM